MFWKLHNCKRAKFKVSVICVDSYDSSTKEPNESEETDENK